MPLPIGLYQPFTISYRDKGGEIGTMSGYGTLVDLEEADAETLQDAIIAADLAWDTFLLATNAITLGVTVHAQYMQDLLINPVSNASSASAQRENKLLVRYHSATGLQKATMTVPTIDLPNLVFLPEAEDKVSLTAWAAGGTVMSDWVTAFQNFVKVPLPDDTTPETVVIDSLEYVGRNT